MEAGLIIAVVGKKGGSGKSTIAENLAVALAVKEKVKVSLIDCDIDQQTLHKWSKRRDLLKEEEGVDIPTIPTVVQSENVKDTALTLAKACDVVIIDIAGRDSKALRQSLMFANIIYAPVRPSQHDLETLDDLYELMQETVEINPKRKAFILFTLAPTNPVISEKRDAEDYVRDFERLMPLSAATISERKAFRDAAITGNGVIELKDDKAKFEITKLLKEVKENV